MTESSPVPIDLVLLQDDSRSMWRGDPAASLRIRAAGLALSLVGVDVSGAPDRIAFASFGSTEQVRVLPLAPVRDGVDRGVIARRICRRTTRKGSTDYDNGLRAAVDALQEGDEAYASPAPPRYRAAGRAVGIVLLSDGQPPEGDWPPPPRPADRSLDLFEARGWPVFTVGVGDRTCAARCNLARIAERTRGRACAAGDLCGIYSEIVREIRHREAVARES